ncbi:protein DpdH [Corallincola platygyrae]|uniref:Protein DpdH n=1 Tax=Corallincola platygyrae TaxID=1193278 RepID=A0ABW4XHA7_9GAMM
MQLMEYWPSASNIEDCIRTEAEELHQHTLLAVHEPMRLLRRDKDGNDIGYDTQEDLLKHFLATPRPLPIIGRAGVGKSHIIRWLDAVLHRQPDAHSWQIVRIPKNASLRGVLEKLLTGLDGEDFDKAREEIQLVSEKLDSHELAELLLTFMGQQLKRLFKQTLEEARATVKSGQKLSPEKEKELRKIKLHALDSSLPALINDSFFKEFLLKKDHCLFRLASRLTKGSSNDEIGENDHQLSADDLDFNFNVSDLSAPARKYVQQARLNTHAQAREEAAEILNLVLGEATRNLFRQLFNFSGGGFPDLFNSIRRVLHQRGMTLMVLVEDMSLISAIEDVLIDSLEREGRRDGEETLCPVCSAIAVTDGYAGYLRRQQGMRDRAKGEWVIEEVNDDREQTHTRIVDFCSRYINAARWGSEELQARWKQHNEAPKKYPWPTVWEEQEIDREFLDAFGRASTGISLYPFNRNAIRALAEKQCRDAQGNLKFNPRQIINKVLLDVLEKCRAAAENAQFPPAELAGIAAPGSLRSGVYRLGLEQPQRAESLAAIWGYPAENMDQLRDKLSADIAACFAMPKLAAKLLSGAIDLPNEPEAPVEPAAPVAVPINQPGAAAPIAPEIDPDAEKIKALGKSLDAWFAGEHLLEQTEARTLRNGLLRLYRQHARSDWHGIKRLPELASGRFVNIELPHAEGNRGQHPVKFCSQRDFRDPIRSVRLRETALAILRFSHFNPDSSADEDWTYPEAEVDLMQMQSFAARWVPTAVNALVKVKHLDLQSQLEAQVHAARTLGILKESDSVRDSLNRLLLSKRKLMSSLKPASCPTVEKLRESALSNWEKWQSTWLDWFAANDHALEGDLLLKALQSARSVSVQSTIEQAVAAACRDLEDARKCIELVSDCDSADEFAELLLSLVDVLQQLLEEGKYPSGGQFLPCNEMTEQLTQLAGTPIWGALSKLLLVSQVEQPLRQWQLLCEIDGEKLRQFTDIMRAWQRLFDEAHTKLQTTNSEWGGQALTNSKNQIDTLVELITQDLAMLQQEVTHENA